MFKAAVARVDTCTDEEDGTMPWSTEYLADLDAVMTVYSGVIPAEALLQAVQATLALGRERGTTRYLADCTALEGGHSIVDLYGLGQLVESAGVPRDSREALVLPQLDAVARDVEFWETTCRNRGFHVRVFRAIAEARAWLTESHPHEHGQS
jgi:hypothetical protein